MLDGRVDPAEQACKRLQRLDFVLFSAVFLLLENDANQVVHDLAKIEALTVFRFLQLDAFIFRVGQIGLAHAVPVLCLDEVLSKLVQQ